jgi:hypothetical protein
MKTHHRVHVKLGKMDRQQITAMLMRGRESARVLPRALILRQLDEGQTGAQVARDVDVARKPVRAMAKRYGDEGLEEAMEVRVKAGPQPATTRSQSLDADRASATLLVSGECQKKELSRVFTYR